MNCILPTQKDAASNLGRFTRTYGFDAASNRTSLKVFGAGAEGGCQQDTAAVDRAHGYDSAGRIREPGYSYDSLRRTLTLPGVDAATPGSTGMQMAYGVDDMVSSLTQSVQDDGTSPAGSSTSVMTYALDPARRVQTITTKVDGTETQRLRYRYASQADSPVVIETSTDQGTSWDPTRYVNIPEVGMVASVTGGGVATLQVANLHGDVVATLPNTTGSAALDSWTETDEYGNQVEPVATGASPARYGYLGSHQRATDTPGGGLTLMGARLYNPVTGAFLSVDSVPGGNVTPYTYPQDPLNYMDLDGYYWEYSKWSITTSIVISRWAVSAGWQLGMALMTQVKMVTKVATRLVWWVTWKGERRPDHYEHVGTSNIYLRSKYAALYKISYGATAWRKIRPTLKWEETTKWRS